MPSHSDESFYMDGVRFGGGGDVGGDDAGGDDAGGDDAGGATSQPPPVHAPKRSPEHSGGVGDEGDEGDGGAAQLEREAKRSLPDDEDIAGPPKRRAAAVKARVMMKESLHPPPLPREKPPLRETPLKGTKTMKAAAVDISALCKALPRGRCNNCPPCLTAVIGKRRCVRSAARELGLPGALLTCLGHQAVGMLVAVAWKADNANYEAIVTRFDAATMKHDVTYCMDGVVETLRLWKTELNVLARSDGGDDADAAPADGDLSDGPAPEDRTPAPKPPPTVNVTMWQTPAKGESLEPPGHILVVDCSDEEEETTPRTARLGGRPAEAGAAVQI